MLKKSLSERREAAEPNGHWAAALVDSAHYKAWPILLVGRISCTQPLRVPSVAMVGANGFRPGLGGSAAEFVLPPPPRPPLRRHPSLSSSVSGALMPRAPPGKWGCRGRRGRPVSRCRRRCLNMFSLQLPPIPDQWFGTIHRRDSYLDQHARTHQISSDLGVVHYSRYRIRDSSGSLCID